MDLKKEIKNEIFKRYSSLPLGIRNRTDLSVKTAIKIGDKTAAAIEKHRRDSFELGDKRKQEIKQNIKDAAKRFTEGTPIERKVAAALDGKKPQKKLNKK